MLEDALRSKGWTATGQMGPFDKGSWRIEFDTGHWMMVSSRSDFRVFDVPVPDEHHVAWTVNLIEHLCRMEDERQRLRTALQCIRDDSSAGPAAHTAATEALAQCYHRWLVDVNVRAGQMGRAYCGVCGCKAIEPG